MKLKIQPEITLTSLCARQPLAGAVKTMAAVAAAVALLAATRASAQNGADTWVGNGSVNFGDLNWTGANNPPISGDSWVFGSAGLSGTTLNNNLLAFGNVAGITFIGPSAFTLTNNAITLTGGLTNLSAALETINFPINSAAVEAVNTSGGGGLTLGGAVSGAGGGFSLTGSGALTFTGLNSFTGPTAIAAGSTLTIGGAGYLGGTTAHVYAGTIANAGVINYNSSGSQTNSAVLSGAGALNVNGPGTLTLSTSPNTMSGATTINGGILQITSSSSGNGNLENSAITVNAAGELDLNANDSLGYAVSIPVTNYGIIKKVNSQSETLFRPIYFAGGSFVTTLTNIEQFETFGNFIATLPNTASFVSGPGKFGFRTATCYLNIAANSTLTFALVVDQNTAGAPLNKTGAGTLILTGTNTYTGNTVISNGTLAINGSGSLGSGVYTGLITNFGTLSYNSSANQLLSGNVTNNGTISFGGSGSVIVSGAITGSGAVNQSGSGTVLLSGANTYTGTTTVSAGKLVVGGAQPDTSPVIVNDGGILGVVMSGSAQYSPSSLALGSSAGATLQLGLTSTTQAPLTPVSLSLIGNNTVVLSGNLAAGNSYPILSSTLSGTGNLSFTLPNGVVGTVGSSLNGGVRTYTLTVTSVTPTLWTGAENGTWDINTTANWSFNSVAGNYLDGSPVQFDDTGLSFLVTNFSGVTVSPSAMVVNNSAHNYAFSNTVAIAGAGGLTKNGTASLTNFTVSTYTGPTVINGGSLVAGVAGAFGLNSAVSLANVAGAALNLNGLSQQIGSLAGGGAAGGNVTLGSGSLAVGGDGSSQTYAGAISGTGGLSKTGAGNLTLTGVNAFTGAISGITGTLTIGGAGYLSGTTPNTYAGTILNNGTFVYSSSASETNTGLMSGTGGVVVNGPGTLTIGTSPSTYSGPTIVNGGFLFVNSANGGNGFAEDSIVTINPGGELDLNVSDALGYSLSLPLTNSGIIKKLSNQAETLGRPIYMNNGSLVTTISGAQQFETFGNFIQTLAGTANSVTGPGSFGLRTASCYLGVATNSTLTFNVPIIQNGNATLSPMNVQGPGTVILTAVSTFGGAITSSGTILLTNTSQLGSGSYAGNIANTGTFIDGSTSAQSLTGIISGNGGILEVTAPGAALTLAGANTYTGPTIIAAGTLFLSGTGSINNSSSITISNGGAFDVSGLTSGTYTMGASQNLIASNAVGAYAVNGSLVAGSSSEIYPGGSGIAATLTFNNGLTLPYGAGVALDISTHSTADGGNNDAMIVTGGLAISGSLGSSNAITLNALSGAANLDTNSDYVLISAPGGLTGGFSSSPIWVGTLPANYAHFTITNDLVNKQVRLHYSVIVSPTITSASATPSTGVVAYQPVLFSVTVQPGSAPITGVSLNLATIGGAGSAPMALSGTPNVWTNTVAIPPGVTPGNQGLQAIVTDTNLLQGNGVINFTVVAATETWDGAGANEDFDTALNWSSLFAPGYFGDSLIFAGTVELGPIMDNNYSVSALTFASAAGAFTIAPSGNNVLTLLANGGVTNISANAQTLQTPVALAGVGTFSANLGNLVLGQPVSEVQAGGGVLTAAGLGTNVLLGDNTYTGATIVNSNSTLLIGGAGQLDNGNYAPAMTVNGTFNYGSSSVQTNAGLISGVGGLTVSGTGTLALGSSPSSYAGPTIVSNGILLINSASGGNGFASNSAYLLVGPAGEVDLNVSDALGYSLTNTITNYGIIKKIASQAETLFRPIYMAGGSLVTTVSGQIQFESFGNFIQTLPNTTNYVTGPGRFGTRTTTCYIGVAANSLFSFAGVPIAQDANGTTSSGLNFGGPGTLMLSGVNTYVGPTIISNNGTLLLADPGLLGGGAYANTIADGGALVCSSTAGQNLSGIISGTGALAVTGSGATLTLSAPNSYAGPTTISQGALYLSGGGSIADSASITITNGGTFDVSQTTSEYALGSGQSLSGAGTVNGLLGVAASSSISPGAPTAVGTLTFNSGLDLSGGAAASFGLSTTYNGNNDQIVVNGALTLNGNVIHISAPSTSVKLDTNSDYILMTSGGITGAANSIPVFDVKPVNYLVFVIQTSGNNLVLHYSPNAAPNGVGFATPNSGVLRNQVVGLTVDVVSSSSPIASVTVAVGGSQVALVQSNGTGFYTNTIVVPPTTQPGLDTLSATITDDNNVTKTVPINFVVVSSTETWNGADAVFSANWDVNANWAVEAGETAPYAPGYVGDNLIFAGSTGLNPNMDNNYTVNALSFAPGASPFVIGSPGNTTLTLASGSAVTNGSASAEMLNLPVLMSGNVTITGGKVTIGPAGSVGNGPAPGTIVDNGNLDYDSANNSLLTSLISGTGSLTLDGTGDLTLSNNNTYSGGTTVNDGTLTLTIGGAAGTIIDTLTINSNGYVSLTVRDGIGYTVGECVSNLVIDGGTFDMVNNAGYSTIVNMTGGTISDVAGTGALFNFYNGFNLNTFASSNGAVISAGIDIRGTNLTITTALGTVPGGADLTVSGIINNSNNTAGVGGIIKAGPGTAVFQGYSTYPGTTTLTGGTLQADVGENPGTSGPFGANDAVGAIVFAGGTLQYSDQNQYDYSGRFSTADGQPYSIDTSNQFITFATALAGNGSSLTKLGLGTLTLTTPNTYSGNTAISGGTLALGGGSSLASSSSISIAAGAILDVTGLSSYALGASASLTASGTAANPAEINGNAGEVISLGSSPVILDFDGSDPALTIPSGVLSLNGNAFTVNGAPLPVGSYVVVTQFSGTITSAGTYTVNGTAVGSQATITVSGGRVTLNVISTVVITPFDFSFSKSGNSLNFSWPASYKGWFLQSNSISLANTNDWFDIAGSSAVTNLIVPINKSGPAVFFRMQAP